MSKCVCVIWPITQLIFFGCDKSFLQVWWKSFLSARLLKTFWFGSIDAGSNCRNLVGTSPFTKLRCIPKSCHTATYNAPLQNCPFHLSITLSLDIQLQSKSHKLTHPGRSRVRTEDDYSLVAASTHGSLLSGPKKGKGCRMINGWFQFSLLFFLGK